MALGVFRVRKPAAGMPECTALVRGCMDYADFGMSARKGAEQFVANAVAGARPQLERQARRRGP